MWQLFVDITGNRVPEVKWILTTVVLSLAAYQVFLMAVGYGKLRLPFLSGRVASSTHRAIGDSIVPVAAFVGLACLAYFGSEGAFDEAMLHGVLGVLLAVVLAVKIAIIRWFHAFNRLLPVLGMSVFVLFGLTTLTAFDG